MEIIYKGNNLFYFYEPNKNRTSSYFYIYFKISSEDELINLKSIIDKNYYTLNQAEIAYLELNSLDTEITLIDFKNKSNFYVTHNKDHIIPFEMIYFTITFDDNITHKGKIMGYDFFTKKYEKLFNNSSFQINEEYFTLNYIFSPEEKNNHGSHIKIYIMTYNSPSRLNLSQTVSNLGIFEYYICQNGFKVCDKDFYLNCVSEFKCYEYCPNIINNNSNNICNYCHPDCNKCNETFNEKSTNCISCSSPNKYIHYGNCVSECKNGYYNDTIEDSIIVKKCKCDYENCYICSLESLNNNNSCITCNKEKGYFQLYNDANSDNNFIKCYKLSEGYYLDNIDNLYKKCYDSCKYCDNNGNESLHNCLECKDDYNYIIQYEKYRNCYINCSYYYYLDNDINELCCTKEMKCSGKYNKLIFGTNQCIDECDKVSKYKFRNICYPTCPEGSVKSEIKPFFCEVICYEEKPFELIYEQECVKNCNINELKKNNCLIKYQDNNKKNNTNDNETEVIIAQDVLLENFRKEMDNYNTSDVDNGQDDVIVDKKMVITFTTTENQKNNLKQENNMTQINLGECETLLREYYKIPADKNIYIKKIDKPIQGMKIPKVEYEIYYKLNNSFTQMNISICENIKIDILIPITINEDINKLNSSSDYYNSICYPTTSIYGTDLTLDNRRKEFLEKNKTVCQDNCIFSEYDFNTKKANCSCDVQKSSNVFNEININKTLLIKNFMDIKKIGNFNILGCYRENLNKKGIMKNIGFYVLLLIEIIHLICAIIFYCQELKILDNIINDINFAINNWKLVIKEQKEKMKLNKIRKFVKKKVLIEDNHLDNQQEEGFIKIPSALDYFYMAGKNFKHRRYQNFPCNPFKKSKNLNKNIQINASTIKKINVINLNNNNTIQQGKSLIIKKINAMTEEKIIRKCKNIMAFNYSEINNLSYKLALKYDQRSYCEYYLSLLKTKHILICVFFNNRDYNSRIIKLDLFFISFAISYAVNALFFNDETIEKIFEDKGMFNFIYHIPQILYSCLISAVLNAILKLFALSEDSVIEFKQDKNTKNAKKRKMDLESKLRCKFAIFFILGFIVLLFCWYYLIMFCAIYRNTQVYLIKDTLISFGLSLCYPLFIYLSPGIFRIPSLSDRKRKRSYLYSISKILQFI